MSKVVSAKKPGKPVFDPSVGYKWEPTDVFEITGLQLASFFHCLNREVNDVQGASVAMKMEAYMSVIDILKRGVEQGVIVEAEATNGVSDAEVVDMFNQ